MAPLILTASLRANCGKSSLFFVHSTFLVLDFTDNVTSSPLLTVFVNSARGNISAKYRKTGRTCVLIVLDIIIICE